MQRTLLVSISLEHDLNKQRHNSRFAELFTDVFKSLSMKVEKKF